MDDIATAATYELASIAQQHALERLVEARATGHAAGIRSAEHAVITEHLSFATSLSKRYRGRGVDRDDLEQLARLALVKAMKRWEPALGTNFLPYAYPTILGEIKRYFRDHGSMVRAPRGLRELHTQTQLAATDLEQRWGRTASDDELAQATGVTAAHIRQQRLAVHGALSLDVETVQNFADQLPNEVAESDMAQVENLIMIRQAVTGLTDRDRKVLQLRYFQEKSQAQIGAIIGVSQMQVSRILRDVLTKLQRAMHEDRPVSTEALLRLAG